MPHHLKALHPAALVIRYSRLALGDLERDPRGRAAYNAAAAGQVDDFRDFIRLHYVSERRDSAFWQDVAQGWNDFWVWVFSGFGI